MFQIILHNNNLIIILRAFREMIKRSLHDFFSAKAIEKWDRS